MLLLLAFREYNPFACGDGKGMVKGIDSGNCCDLVWVYEGDGVGPAKKLDVELLYDSSLIVHVVHTYIGDVRDQACERLLDSRWQGYVYNLRSPRTIKVAHSFCIVLSEFVSSGSRKT